MIIHNFHKDYKGFILLLPFNIPFLLLSIFFKIEENKNLFYIIRIFCFIVHYFTYFVFFYHFSEIYDIQIFLNDFYIISILLILNHRKIPRWINNDSVESKNVGTFLDINEWLEVIFFLTLLIFLGSIVVNGKC